jgi:hypothetical protein
MTILLVLVAIAATLTLTLWLIGAREPVYAISASDGPHWFIAIRGDAGALAPGVAASLTTSTKFSFIGPDSAKLKTPTWRASAFAARRA